MMKRMMLLATFSSLLFSCKKEEIKFPYTGTWKFAGATATKVQTYVKNTDRPNADYDSIVYLYTSHFSKFDGTVEITPAAWEFSTGEYTYDEQIEAFTYKNGSITATEVQTQPSGLIVFFSITSAQFKVINADSVYFHGEQTSETEPYYWPSPTQNNGAGITVSGDTMRVHSVVAHYAYKMPDIFTHAGRMEKTITYVR